MWVSLLRMGTIRQRILFLLRHEAMLSRWVGVYDENSLIEWLRAELGSELALDEWLSQGNHKCRAVPLGEVLHVVSGNTPHAAFQSLFRALLVGCRSRMKLPSTGLPEFEQWLERAGLGDWVEARRELPDEWKSPDAAVIFGGSGTVDFFRSWLTPGTRIIEHGPKLSAAFVFENAGEITDRLAEDVMRFDQRGCLSVRMIYVIGNVAEFCENLARALERYVEKNGWSRSDLSEAGGVRNERETIRFLNANGASVDLWESAGSTAWTVVSTEDRTLKAGSGGGLVTVAPMPDEISRQTLGGEIDFLSTAVVEPLSEAWRLDGIAPPRICAAGQAQEPGILWHPDGESPLAGLVRWRDLG